MANKQVDVPLPAFEQGMATCMANAAYWQRVTLVIGTSRAVFTGTGETVPMEWAPGEQMFDIPGSTSATTAHLLFEYSKNGPNGPFLPAAVSKPVIQKGKTLILVTVVSEDSADNDLNDSYFTLSLKLKAGHSAKDAYDADQSAVASALPGSVTNATLEIHAKTYYDVPGILGDEHSIKLFLSDRLDGNIDYIGLVWKLDPTRSSWEDQKTKFGGYLSVDIALINPSIPELRGATLKLGTIIGYWFSRPTGFLQTCDWTGYLEDTSYKVTRTTE